MAVSKVVLNERVLIDVTQDTVESNKMTSGTTAHKNDGTVATGNIATKSAADLTASGKTVTVPAGVYASQATKNVAETTHPTPLMYLNSSTGVVTAYYDGESGYAEAITRSSSYQLTTTVATTITPTTTTQTAVSSGVYTLGAIKVAAMPTGTQGTPIATKGAVSNYAVSITPQVTNGEGWIAGGTKTGSAVTVSARELVAGTTLYCDDAASWDCANAETFVVQAGTEGTPTATKGTVSNHSISITPSVTNGEGWITGGTKTGTAVTVSASDLVSGTYTVNAAGTTNVTNYASISVPTGSVNYPTASKGTVTNHSISVTPAVSFDAGYISGGAKTGNSVTVTAGELVSGTTNITQNGTYDVTNYASASINVSGSPTGTTNITSNGIYDVASYASANVSVQGSAEEKSVEFMDYDGTILYSYTPTEFAALTALPSNPSHTGLVAQGWNWSLAEAKTYVSTHKGLVIGQNYTTDDGTTRLYIDLPDIEKYLLVGLYLGATVAYGVVINWGDGDTTIVDSKDAIYEYSHTYAEGGSYVIVIEVFDGKMILANGIINNNTFQGHRTTLSKIELGDNITVMSNNTFYIGNDFYLKSISIPNDIEGSNGGFKISGCSALSGIVVPSIYTKLPSEAFSYNASCKRVSLPNTITSASNSTFTSDYNLRYVYIPDSVTTYGTNTFYYCYSLTKVALPSSVTTLPSGTFNNCTSLTSFDLSNITSMGSQCFVNNYSLRSVDLSTVTSIGTSAFAGCSSLKSIGTYNSALTSFPSRVFYQCATLEQTIPSKVTFVGEYAFYYNRLLTNACLPSDLTAVPTAIFYNCGTLSSINIPNTVTTIYSSAFASCFSLKNVALSSGLTTLMNGVFAQCGNLAQLSLPTSLVSVGSSAFSYSGLVELTAYPTQPPTAGNSAFYGLSRLTKVYVPRGSLNAYQTATNWSAISSLMVEM